MQRIDYTDLEKTGRACGITTAEEYHRRFHSTEAGLQHCISKSSLVDYAACPYLYRYNLENGIRKSSPGFRFGSLIDTLVLTPDEFNLRYKVEARKVATKKDGTPYSNGQQDKEQAAEWAALEAEGITVISPEELSEAEEVRDKTNKTLANAGLVLGDTFDAQVGLAFRLELPIFDDAGAQIATCPVITTGMIDILPRDPELPIIDLKTSSKPVHIAFEVDKQIRSYYYGWQAAFYADMIRAVLGQDRFFRFLFVGADKPHLRRWVDMRKAELDIYRRQYMPWLLKYAESCHTNTWPGEEEEARQYVVAPWEEFSE